MKTQKTKPAAVTSTITLPKGHCGNPRCKHEWLVRVEKPVKCPRCHSTNIYVYVE